MKKSLNLFLVVAMLSVFSNFAKAEIFGSVDASHIKVVSLNVSGDAVYNGSVQNVPNVSSYSALKSTTAINPYGKGFIVITTTAAISVGTTPSISTMAAVNGQELTIMSSSYTVTFSDNGTLSGSLLELGAATRAVGDQDVLKLFYYKGKWRETSYNNLY